MWARKMPWSNHPERSRKETGNKAKNEAERVGTEYGRKYERRREDIYLER